MNLPFTIDWNSLATGAVGGLIVFVVTLISEYFVRRFERLQEKQEQSIVTFHNETRKITGSIFSYLSPGATIEMMRNDLGPPNRQYTTEAGLYSKETLDYAFAEQPEYSQSYTAYLYFFKNAHVKIISEDERTIAALTVMSDDEDIHFPHEPERFFNSYMIDTSFFDECKTRSEHFPGCRDTVTACTLTYYSPGREAQHITHFVYNDMVDFYESDLQNDPNSLLGSKVSGICISSQLENVSYIYLSEL